MTTPQINYELHPRGTSGSAKSIRKTVQAAAAGRLDPKVALWAHSRLAVAGVQRAGKSAQAQALLAAIRAEKFWIPDPVDAERIGAPACLLADCDGLSFDAGDCDDLSAALAAALESVGIVAAIVGQAFNDEVGFQHVLVACEVADGEWFYADPSEGLPFGQANKPTREIWRLVPSGRVLCDRAPDCIGEMQGVHVDPSDRMAGDSVYIGDMGPSIVDAPSDVSTGSRAWDVVLGVLFIGVAGLAVYGGYSLAKEYGNG